MFLDQKIYLNHNYYGIKCYISSKHCETASYDDIKKVTQNQNEILLIDVREPHELVETGKLPNSINISCKVIRLYFHKQLFYFYMPSQN